MSFYQSAMWLKEKHIKHQDLDLLEIKTKTNSGTHELWCQFMKLMKIEFLESRMDLM